MHQSCGKLSIRRCAMATVFDVAKYVLEKQGKLCDCN